jgi:thymidylate synthase (FAD)
MENKVELLSYWGNDEMIANVARVSYGKDASNYTEEQNAKLLKYLWEHGHTSPFRHPHLQFRVKCPIFVERQLFKHVVGVSVNSISGRYVDFSDEYYMVPEGEWRKQSKSSKQGSDGLCDAQKIPDEVQREVIRTCKNAYAYLVGLGVSKEQARLVLPLSLMTEFIWTGSLQAFLHMYALRSKLDAQKETRDIVLEMCRLVENIEGNPFEHTLKMIKPNK